MGVRAGVVVCVTSFLLGALFTHWIADSLTLWKSPVTDEHLWTAASYYSIIANGPSEGFYVLTAIVTLGALTILWSLNDLGAENIMFDGGSIFLFGTSIVLYYNSVFPSIFTKFRSLPTHHLKEAFPKSLRSMTLDLATNNLICSVALTGVLVLQAGRSWAERSDNDDDEDYVLVESENSTGETVSKTISAAPTTTTTNPTNIISRAITPDIREDKVEPLLRHRLQPS